MGRKSKANYGSTNPSNCINDNYLHVLDIVYHSNYNSSYVDPRKYQRDVQPFPNEGPYEPLTNYHKTTHICISRPRSIGRRATHKHETHRQTTFPRGHGFAVMASRGFSWGPIEAGEGVRNTKLRAMHNNRVWETKIDKKMTISIPRSTHYYSSLTLFTTSHHYMLNPNRTVYEKPNLNQTEPCMKSRTWTEPNLVSHY